MNTVLDHVSEAECVVHAKLAAHRDDKLVRGEATRFVRPLELEPLNRFLQKTWVVPANAVKTPVQGDTVFLDLSFALENRFEHNLW